jgi:BCD family chlorophyll transporter-like MFS transporter
MQTFKTILNNLRLAFFPIAYGLSGALVGGTLNRILIADMEVSAALVGLLFALPLLVSPARVWFGYRSDGYPIMGRRREPYIILGAVLIGLGVIGATAIPVSTAARPIVLALGSSAAFVIYGIGRNLGLNTFHALLSDRFQGANRQRAITFYEVATLLGLVMGAGGLGAALEVYDPGRLVQVAVAVAVVILVLAAFATLQQEPRTGGMALAAEKSRQIPFARVLKEYVFSDPQVRIFFTLVFFTFVGTLAQDVLLEPYGALVLGMEVGQTTRLTAFWGIGVMISMLLSAAVLVKRLGFMRLMRTGIITSALVFVGVIVVGALGNPGAFRGLVFVMGLGTGLAGAGMLAGVISFTTTIRAGMLMGVWGVANMVGHAFGSLMGGGVVEIMRLATGGNAFVAYSAVFALEVTFLMVALYLSTRLVVPESRAFEEAQMEAVFGAAD